ncbi:HypC/HybG/HupF family hydrogenase formation chaperone [Frigidibacter sp. MR17.14]|uniref:HypC/HybG/HupF family hydrogenase formation chaperone n=1 Tax=Frigidibacter sp. MR17.14 TaxID=3126509 RepID=UPI003012A340
MCLGIPMRLIAVHGIAGRSVDAAGVETLIDLSLTPAVRAGDWVLTFLGAAREVLAAEEAHRIAAALAGLTRLMAGGSLGDAFADLEAGGPRLPPHLQAALDAGQDRA